MSDIPTSINREPTPQYPLMSAIESGDVKIKFVGEEGGSSRSRVVNGDKWLGREFVYSFNMPKSFSSDRWETEVAVWSPTKIDSEFWRPDPGIQIFIQTGNGEMLLTEKEENKQKILTEINRQLEEADKAK